MRLPHHGDRNNAKVDSQKGPFVPRQRDSSKAQRDHELALYHANLIQDRKDMELEILLSTETLIDYPLSRAPFDASNPAPADAAAFKSLLRPFQPSDYDALILERNINNHCGYALCPNPRATDGEAGKYRIIGKTGKAKDFKVVERQELEKWCSDACAKRALYVQVQLSETPFWERDAASIAPIDLLDEPKSEEMDVVDRMEKMDLDGDKSQGHGRNGEDLALERGDTGLAAKRGLVDVKVEEKEVRRPAEAPSLDAEDLNGRFDSMHLTMEGYTPSFGSARQRRHHEELAGVDGEDYDEDTDWKF